MIIDCHQHFTLPSRAEHESVLRRYDIERALVIPLDFGRLEWREVLKFVGMKPKPPAYKREVLDRLAVVNMNLLAEIGDSESMHFVPWVSVSNPGSSDCPCDADAAKFIPPLDDCGNNYIRMMVDKIESLLQRIIIIHTGWSSSPILFAGLVELFPDKTFVFAHMKEDFDSDNTERKELLTKFDNLYLETSYCAGPHRIKEYVDLGFGDRLLFGSDYRGYKYDPFFEWQVDMVSRARVDAGVRRAILHDNAVELLK